jgi:sodium/potassium/calcium exchanger 6
LLLTQKRHLFVLAGAALMCTAGFIVAATWIAFVAQELVAMLQFFGRLSGVSSAVLGLTVLAWGNSIGDLSTNIAMAKRCGPLSLSNTRSYSCTHL